MDGKNIVVVVVVGLAAMGAKTTWHHATATAASSPTVAPLDPPPASALTKPSSEAGSSATLDPGGSAAAATGKGYRCAESLECQLEASFPGAFAKPSESSTIRPDRLKYPLNVVLVTLPNPASSGFPAEFDRGVEAILRAAQSQRYVVHQRFFPWDAAVTPESAAKSGWLLMRRDGKTVDVELLLFLIVGEHLGSGVDEAALNHALDSFKQIVQRGHSAPAVRPLLLLGPYFSGTAVSLKEQLRSWCLESQFCASRDLFSVSGSATRRQTQGILADLAESFKTSTFHATVLPDDLLVAGMHRFLSERLDVPDSKVAELTEASTDYGNAVASSEVVPRGARAFNKGIKIPFPFHIGVLRGNGEKGSRAPVNPDFPKPFDSLAAAKTRLLLENTFSALSRHGVRHVGVLATSTQDKIFLVTELRRSAPDLRIHLYESSVDLADRDLREALEGTVVASSYPLFPSTQLWADDSGGALQQFPTDGAEGVFNATLVLIARFDTTLAPTLTTRMLDYVSPFCPAPVLGPSAWISVVIAGRLWPLAVYPSSLSPKLQNPPCTTTTPDPYVFADLSNSGGLRVPRPRIQSGFMALLGLLAVFLLSLGNLAALIARFSWMRGAFFFVTYRMQPSLQKSQPMSHFALDAKEPQHRVALLGLWSLAITAVVMAKIFGLPHQLVGIEVLDPGPLQQAADILNCLVLAVAVAMVVAGLLATAAGLWGRSPWQSSTGALWRSGSVWTQLILCLFMVAAIFLLPPTRIVEQPDGHAYFFYLRSMDPGVGLTPTLPLFMVGAATYMACLLRLLVIRRATALKEQAQHWSADSFTHCRKAMENFAEDASGSLLQICLIGGFLGLAVLFFSPLQLGSLEGRGFDAGTSACFGLAFALTLAAAWRAFSLWQKLRDFTRALALHPAQAALKRLPMSVAQTFRSPVPGQIGRRHIEVALHMKQRQLGLSALPALADLLPRLDRRWFPSAEETSPDNPSSSPFGPPAPQRTAAMQPLNDVEILEEDFLALRMAEVLGLMCDSTRTMVLIATVSGLATLLATALYPFQPAATLTAAGLVSVGLVVAVALRVLLGIERDEVLSAIAKTEAGKITPTLGLTTRLAGYVLLPLAGLIGTRLQRAGALIDFIKELTKTLER